jgi:hypothetical protein
MKSLFTSIIFCFLFITSNAQDVVSSTFLRKIPKLDFFSKYGIFTSNDVLLYRLKYTTIDVDGKPTTASGLITLPDNKTLGLPILAYHHGTVASRFEVPGYDSYESTIPAIFAALGYIGIATDYLGLGDSPGLHPYVHANSEATASRDLLIAAVKFVNDKGYSTTKDLFITGYSQGGHAGMAFHKMMEENPLGFKLKAASHLSGPYSISTGMKELLLSQDEYTQVAYLAYTALSYNAVYKIFPDNDIYKMFKPTYAKLIEKFAYEQIDLFKLNGLMIDSLKAQYGKAIPSKMMIDAVVSDVNTNTNHPINVALRANDVYDWKPTIPTRLIYCKADEQVAYTNSIIAEKKMKENGAVNVLAIDQDTKGSHNSCVNPAILATISFFSNYYLASSDETPIEKLDEPIAYPNPATDMLYLNSSQNVTNAIFLSVIGNQYKRAINDNAISLDGIPSGTYVVLIKNSKGYQKYLKVVIAN